MFNLKSLNPIEFEDLCRDIAEKMLNKTVRTFAVGRDGGIDLADVFFDTVIQCKHVEKYSNLKSTLKKEAKNICKKVDAFTDFYVFTSCSLTPDNVKEIVGLFSFFPFFDAGHVKFAEDIQNFLSENPHVVRKHHKLWYCSDDFMKLLNNQDIFLDSDTLVQRIKDNSSLYVETSVYKNALKLFKDKKCLLIVGNPGVGKSTLSEMLVLFFAKEGYHVRYTSTGELSGIKKSLSPNDKEIILLDDFLGSNDLDLSNEKVRQTEALIAHVKNQSEKKLILNSRLSLFNQAKEKAQKFGDVVDGLGDAMVVVNCDDMTKEDKAQILYNHLYHQNIAEEYFEDIRRDQNYRKIISHSNYNPRIIEYATKPKVLLQVQPEKYSKFIIDKLNNPQDVWADEFRNKLSIADRWLAYVIYTLGGFNVKKDVARKAFRHAIQGEQGIDKSIDTFNVALLRLTDSILVIRQQQNEQYLSFINPSVSDYVIKEFETNDGLRNSFLDKALYVEQLKNIFAKYDAEMEELITSGAIMSYQTHTHDIRAQFIKLVATKNICNEGIKSQFQQYFRELFYGQKRPQTLSLSLYTYYTYLQQIFCDILSAESIIDFYGLQDFFTDANNYEIWLEFLEYQQLVDVFNDFEAHFLVYEQDLDTYDEILEWFRQYTYEAILDEAFNNVDISAIIAHEVAINWDYDTYASTFAVDRITEDVVDSIVEECKQMMGELIGATDMVLNIDKKIDARDVIEKIDEYEIEKEVEQRIDGEMRHEDFDMEEYFHYSRKKADDWSAVDKLFNK